MTTEDASNPNANTTKAPSECYHNYWFGDSSNCTATTFPATCYYYSTTYNCYEIKDSKD